MEATNKRSSGGHGFRGAHAPSRAGVGALADAILGTRAHLSSQRHPWRGRQGPQARRLRSPESPVRALTANRAKIRPKTPLSQCHSGHSRLDQSIRKASHKQRDKEPAHHEQGDRPLGKHPSARAQERAQSGFCRRRQTASAGQFAQQHPRQRAGDDPG